MLLTIAIPSNNKTFFLKKAIDSIVKESDFGKEVDLVISDNSFGSETSDLYKNKYIQNKNIYWFNSKEYESLDSNVNRAVELSKGKYVWIFGDDDIIEKGILSALVKYLKNIKPEILVLNSKSFLNSEIIEEFRMPIKNEKIYKEDENDKFLKEMGSYLTYIGAILVKRDLWISSYDFSKIGTFFAHIACIANMKIGRCVYYFPSPAIKMRIGSQTWTNKSFIIWHKFYPEVIWGLDNYSEEAKSSVITKKPMESTRVLVASRAYGRLNFSIWKKIIIKSRINLKSKVISLFITIIPSKFLAILYIIYIIYFRKKHTFSFSPNLALAKLKF